MTNERPETLGRVVRQDEAAELGIPTWALIREAILGGKTDETLKLVDYAYFETKKRHDSMVTFVDDTLSSLATFGEEEIHKLMRKRYLPKVKQLLADAPGAEEALQMLVEGQRGHGGNITVREEAERYVVSCNPCGSGGQLRITKDAGKVKNALSLDLGKERHPLLLCTLLRLRDSRR